jgi:hypothetical protein
MGVESRSAGRGSDAASAVVPGRTRQAPHQLSNAIGESFVGEASSTIGPREVINQMSSRLHECKLSGPDEAPGAPGPE